MMLLGAVVAEIPWWRHKKWIIVAGVGAGLIGLMATVLVALALTRDKPVRRPFEEALLRLAEAPAVQHKMSLGSITSDVRVTAQGAAYGTTIVAGQRIETLTVGGKTYVKLPEILAPGEPGATKGREGKWSTGGAQGRLGASSSQMQTPIALAQSLLAGINDERSILPQQDTPATSVGGVEALKAVTPGGELYVAKNPPYRVLRIATRGGARGVPSRLPSPSSDDRPPSIPPVPSIPDDFLPNVVKPVLGGSSAFRQALRAAQPAAGAGTIDFPALSRADVDKLFREIVKNTKQLKDAVDNDIQFRLTSKPDLKCGSSGCVVVAHVNTDVSSSNRKAIIAGGKVLASLTATVAIDGQPAGSCTSKAVLPLNGTSNISCRNGAAGAVFSRVQAVKRAQARAQSRAQGGRPVRYTISSTGQAHVRALAKVNVRLLLDRLDIDQWLGQQSLPGETTAPNPRPSQQPTRQPSRQPSPGKSTGPQRPPTLQPSPGQSTSPQPQPSQQPSAGRSTSPQRPPSQQPSPGQSTSPQPQPSQQPSAGRGTSPQPQPSQQPSFGGSPSPSPTDDDEGWDCKKIRPPRYEPNGDGWNHYTSGGAKNRSQTAQACLKNHNKGHTGDKPDPVGWEEAREKATGWGFTPEEVLARCHLIPARFGGSNGNPANFSPCWQQPTNQGLRGTGGGMTGFENLTARQLKNHPDWAIHYIVDPRYKTNASTIPRGFLWYARAYDSSGKLTWVDRRLVPNVKVIGNKSYELAN